MISASRPPGAWGKEEVVLLQPCTSCPLSPPSGRGGALLHQCGGGGPRGFWREQASPSRSEPKCSAPAAAHRRPFVGWEGRSRLGTLDPLVVGAHSHKPRFFSLSPKETAASCHLKHEVVFPVCFARKDTVAAADLRESRKPRAQTTGFPRNTIHSLLRALLLQYPGWASCRLAVVGVAFQSEGAPPVESSRNSQLLPVFVSPASDVLPKRGD